MASPPTTNTTTRSYSVSALAHLSVSLVCCLCVVWPVAAKSQAKVTDFDADITWAAAAFDSSRESEWAELLSEAEALAAASTQLERERLEEEGRTAHALEQGCYSDVKCAAITEIELIRSQFSGLDDFRRHLDASAKLIGAVDLTQNVLDSKISQANADPATKLVLLSTRDQIVRSIYVTVSSDAVTFEIDAKARAAALLWLKLRAVQNDIEASAYVEALLDQYGWERIRNFGELGLDAAWLLVQHADRRPSLQVRVLDAMSNHQPREVSASQYAMLYDRVQLALGYPQYYGTQIGCIGGSTQPVNLIDPENVDERRRTIQLPPIEEYIRIVGEVCAPR